MKNRSEKPEFVPFGLNLFGDILVFRKYETSVKPYIGLRSRIYPFKAVSGLDVSVPYTLDYVIDVSDDRETACREFVLMCESEGKVPDKIRRTEPWS